MIYGYCRVSTPRQRLERQIKNIKEADENAVIVKEKYTGTSTDRPVWSKLEKQLKEGDIVIFDSVSRMSRNADEGFQLYMRLYEKGVELQFIKEPMIDTAVYRNTSQLMMTGTDVDVVLDGINRYLILLAERQIRIAFEQSEKEVEDMRKTNLRRISTREASRESNRQG